MDMRKIRKLIELIKETGIAEIEIREGEQSVRISREVNRAPQVAYGPPPPIQPGLDFFSLLIFWLKTKSFT